MKLKVGAKCLQQSFLESFYVHIASLLQQSDLLPKSIGNVGEGARERQKVTVI